MKLSLFAALLIAALVGALAGRWTAPAPHPEPPAEHAREELAHFAENELQEYIRLRESRARYDKADELLGKALLVLIADLGIRVSPEVRNFAENATAPRSAPSPAPDRDYDRERETDRRRSARLEPEKEAPAAQQFFPPFPAQPEPEPTPAPTATATPNQSPRTGAAALLAGPVSLDHLGGTGKRDVNGNRLGWQKNGSDPGAYDIFMAGGVGTVHARVENARGSGALVDILDAGAAAGHRLKVTAWIRATSPVEKGALYMQVSDRDGNRAAYTTTIFESTFDWREFQLSLDLPPHAWKTYFGLRLEGKGQAQIRDVVLDVTR